MEYCVDLLGIVHLTYSFEAVLQGMYKLQKSKQCIQSAVLKGKILTVIIIFLHIYRQRKGSSSVVWTRYFLLISLLLLRR